MRADKFSEAFRLWIHIPDMFLSQAPLAVDVDVVVEFIAATECVCVCVCVLHPMPGTNSLTAAAFNSDCSCQSCEELVWDCGGCSCCCDCDCDCDWGFHSRAVVDNRPKDSCSWSIVCSTHVVSFLFVFFTYFLLREHYVNIRFSSLRFFFGYAWSTMERGNFVTRKRSDTEYHGQEKNGWAFFVGLGTPLSSIWLVGKIPVHCLDMTQRNPHSAPQDSQELSKYFSNFDQFSGAHSCELLRRSSWLHFNRLSPWYIATIMSNLFWKISITV